MSNLFFYTWLGIWVVIMTGVMTMNACGHCRSKQRTTRGLSDVCSSFLSLATVGWLLYLVIWAIGTGRVLGAQALYAAEQLNTTTVATYVYYSYASLTVSVISGIYLFVEVRVFPNYAGPPQWPGCEKGRPERFFYITPMLWIYLIAQSGINLYITLQIDVSTGQGPQAFDIISAVAQCLFIVIMTAITFVPHTGTPYLGVNKMMATSQSPLNTTAGRLVVKDIPPSELTCDEEPREKQPEDSSLVEASRLNMCWFVCWGFIQTNVALKFFIDTPRVGAYVVMTIMFPLLFALLMNRLGYWLHYAIIANASFWIALWFFPTVANSTYNYDTYPGAFILTTWGGETTYDVYDEQYTLSISSLLWVTLIPIVGTLSTWWPQANRFMGDKVIGSHASTAGMQIGKGKYF